MKRLIVFIPLILLVAVFLFNAATAPTIPKSSSVVFPVTPTATPTPVFSEDKLWSLIQNWRQSQGLKPYIKDQRLCTLAQSRTPYVEQEITNRTPHKGLYKMFKQGVSYLPSGIQVSENIADDFAGEQDMLTRWLNSPEHLANLKANYTYSCLACVKTACAQEFSNFSSIPTDTPTPTPIPTVIQ